MKKMENRNEIIKGCGLHHISIRVADYETSVRFYAEGLGFKKFIEWRAKDKVSMCALLDAGDGTHIELLGGAAPGSRIEEKIHIAFKTDDCDGAFKRALAYGAVPDREPTDTTLGDFGTQASSRYAKVKGPDGEILEFCHYK